MVNDFDKGLIKVNYSGEETGVGEKAELHSSPMLHKAFSVFIYHGEKMFIHKRNKEKYHSGGLWTNACCSHFRAGISEEECLKERLLAELGISAVPEYLTKFIYFHKFSASMYEYEYDHIYLLDYEGEFEVNPEEIEETAWVDIEFLAKDILQNPEKYTVWFITAFGFVYNYLKGKK